MPPSGAPAATPMAVAVAFIPNAHPSFSRGIVCAIMAKLVARRIELPNPCKNLEAISE